MKKRLKNKMVKEEKNYVGLDSQHQFVIAPKK